MAEVYSLICWGGRTGKTVTISNATPAVVTSTNHGLRDGTGLVFTSSGLLPAGITSGTTYYAKSTAANTFNLYDTAAHAISGGATGRVNTSSAGSGTHTAKSDLIVNPSTRLSAYGLSDLSRWGESGSELIYDGLLSFKNGRSGAGANDIEICEIGEAFDDWITAKLVLSVPSASTTIESKINGIRSAAWHAGSRSLGYCLKSTVGYDFVMDFTGYRTTLDGVRYEPSAATFAYGFIINGVFNTVKNCLLFHALGSDTTGMRVAGSSTTISNNVVIGFLQYGIALGEYAGQGSTINNNTVVKCLAGFKFLGTTNTHYGWVYNNIAVGNTTNWQGSSTGFYGAGFNGGLSTDSPWFKGTDTSIKTLTADNSTFVDYSGNDLRPAGDSVAHTSSSPLVDSGRTPVAVDEFDMLGNARPDYKNGSATSWDIGAHEFDWGYAIPSSDYRGLAFTGLIAGSEVKVFETGTQTTVFSDTSSATSETWSENATGSRTVDYTILKDGYVPIRVTGIVVTGATSGGVLSTPIQQEIDRAYVTPSGLAIGSTATYSTGTKRFTVTTATTVQNWYSYMVQCWRTESALANVTFPISSNGPNSFQLAGDWQFSSGISYLSRDGLRYLNSSGVVTDSWAAVLSVGVPSGMQVRYQQIDGSGTANAANTGNVDQLIKIYENGSYDYTGHMVLKVQADGYDQAEFDLVSTFGTLEDQFYVAGLNPVANGVASGTVTGVTITDHGASPVTWNSKSFSITITDTTGHTGEQILQYVRGLNSFNYHDLVQTNGTEFKTVRGRLYGDTGASLKGVRVVQSDGTTSHADFNLHTADDGTTYIPPLPPAAAEATIMADSRVQLYNVTTATEIDNAFVTGTSYNYVITSEASDGDVLRLRVCKLGKEAGEAFAVWGASGATFLITQPASAEYATWGIDGSTVTEFTGDVSGHIYIDANDLDGATTKTRLGAWYSWVLTTDIGIRHFFGAVTYVSSAAIRINTDIADILIENTNASTALRFTDLSVRLYRSDGSSVIAPTSYSIHNDYSGVPDVVETGVSGLTGSESAQLMGLPNSTATASAVWSAGTRTLTSTAGGGDAPTPEENAAAVLAALNATTIPVDMQKTNGVEIIGDGSAANKFRSINA